MNNLVRAEVNSLPVYVPSPPVPDAIVLATNEVPYGPLPGVSEAVARAVAAAHRYPDPAVAAVRTRLGALLGVDPDRIATGCGSVGLTEHLIRTICAPGDEIVFAWPSFEAYPLLSAISDVRAVQVPLTPAHEHDLPAMAAAITERTAMVLLCSPNNPTGTAIRRADLDAFLAAVPSDVLVVLDEAYHEFVTDPDVPDGVAEYGDHANVAVLRTLSKAWGLAGLRLGYLVARPEVAGGVRKVVTAFSVNGLAQAAGLAALDAGDEMRRRVALITRERERVGDAVTAALPGSPIGQGNFVWLPLGARSADFGGFCRDAGVVVRAFAGSGVRVTIGTPEQNDAFLAVLARWPG